MALTFKHAVEFSSFGCTPRVCLFDSRLGLLDLLYSGFSLESNPVSSHFAEFFVAISLSRSGPEQPNLLYSVPQSESNPTFGPELPLAVICFRNFWLSGNLPYLTRIFVAVKSAIWSWPPPALRDPCPCRRVAERAGPRATWCGWVPLGSAAARVFPFAASRAPQGSENITRVFRLSQIGPL